MEYKRHHYIDAIRVAGMFSVILLHSCSVRLRMYIGSFGWHFVNIITSLATIAVPLFFMVSGAVILGSRSTEDYGYVLKRRIPKMFLPLLLWSIVSLVSDYFVGIHVGTEGIGTLVLSKAKVFLTSPVRIHFWFMYTLIPLYIISPLLKSVIQHRRNLKYAIALFFCISLLESAAHLLPGDYGFITNITFIKGATFGTYTYYFLLGYLLHTSSRRFNALGLVCVAAAAWIAIIIGTYWKSSGGTYIETFKSYIGIFCLILSSAFFLLFKRFYQKPNPVVTVLAPLSFGVYLMHGIIIAAWVTVFSSPEIVGSLKYAALCFATNCLVSCGTIWLLSRFKLSAYLFCGVDKP